MFIGNQKVVQFLSKAAASNKIAQAYLFSGPESVGKFSLAKIFAKSLITGRNLDLNLDDKIIPDLIILEPEIEEKKGIIKEKEIKIEQIRFVQKDLILFPYRGKCKVLIVNNAHKMTVSSQNALLKTLEEPNKTSIIILITHNDSKILPTLKSRCQEMKFSLVDFQEIKKLTEKNKNSKEIIQFSMGRPGLAFRMLENIDEVENRKKDFEELQKFPAMGINERLKLAEKFSLDLSATLKKLEFWEWVIRSNVLKRGNSRGFLSFETIEKIEKVLETIKNTNANARLAIENLFLEI